MVQSQSMVHHDVVDFVLLGNLPRRAARAYSRPFITTITIIMSSWRSLVQGDERMATALGSDLMKSIEQIMQVKEAEAAEETAASKKPKK